MKDVREQGSSLATALDSGAADALLSLAGDVTLLLDHEGIVRDVAATPALAAAAEWVGRPFAALVTVEGKPKVAELVADALASRTPR